MKTKAHSLVVQARIMRRHGSRFLTILIACTISLPIFAGLVAAEEKWNEDGWLRTSIAEDRLLLGDEFGCYGMPHLSTFNDPGAVANECTEYIQSRIPASIWGEQPLSIYTPQGLTMTQHQIIKDQGYAVHGDLTGIEAKAWHTNQSPNDIWDWFNLGRRGGSLEQSLSDVNQLNAALAEGGLVNLYWVGRVNDATIRHDGDVVDILRETPAWMTTWGEAWSYWSAHRCYLLDHGINQTSNGTSIIYFESQITEACSAVQPDVWNVPVTWILDFNGSNFYSIESSSEDFNNIEFEKSTKEGWFENETLLYLSVKKGTRISIHFESNETEYDIMGRTDFWNNHSTAVTIAGHATNDLFQWSKRFDDDPFLRFTWLVIPRNLEDGGDWIPYAVVGVSAGSIAMMLYFIRRDVLSSGDINDIENKTYPPQLKRRVDFEEEEA